MEQGDIVYSVMDSETGKVSYHKHESSEPAYIDEIRILDGDKEKGVQKVSIKYRYNRNPVVGDKFSSRHGPHQPADAPAAEGPQEARRHPSGRDGA